MFVLPSERLALGLPSCCIADDKEVETAVSEELNAINKAKLSRKKKKCELLALWLFISCTNFYLVLSCYCLHVVVFLVSF